MNYDEIIAYGNVEIIDVSKLVKTVVRIPLGPGVRLGVYWFTRKRRPFFLAFKLTKSRIFAVGRLAFILVNP